MKDGGIADLYALPLRSLARVSDDFPNRLFMLSIVIKARRNLFSDRNNDPVVNLVRPDTDTPTILTGILNLRSENSVRAVSVKRHAVADGAGKPQLTSYTRLDLFRDSKRISHKIT